MKYLVDSHCGYCGASYEGIKGWPRRCTSCRNMAFRNPIPVAVVLLPILAVGDTTARGLLAIRRGIEPGQGMLALPGGYVDFNENWRAAALRELLEETAIRHPAGVAGVRIADTFSNPQGDRVLIFCSLPALSEEALPDFEPTQETTERVVLTEAQEMAFSLHTDMVARHFAQL